jgi:rfaE bifunctional protein nucleotidyltransferase chain/domain
MDFRNKVIPLDGLPSWRNALRKDGRQLVVTNGCFDILHLGHATYLEAARKQGDALLVGINSDATVRELKGPRRPVNAEPDRAALVAALASVDAVCIFPEMRATRFLTLAQPDIYVKGGDYAVDTIPQEERRAVERLGAKIIFLPLVPGRSTTALLEKIEGV